MRICFLSQEDIVAPQGGTGTYVRNVSMALAARGHDVHVISRHRAPAPAFECVDGVVVHRVAAPGPAVLYSPLYFAQSRRAFAALHRITPFDLIHGNLPLMSSWGVRGPHLPPVVETVHCTVREELKALAAAQGRPLNSSETLTRALAPVIRQRERALLQRAGQIIAVSAGLRRELIEQYAYPAAGIAVIPNGIHYQHFAQVGPAERAAARAALGIGAEERVILYLGRLMERKRVIDLVAALPQVLQQVPTARLVIVGKQNANGAQLAALAQRLGIAARVTFVDHVPYQAVPAYYALADVYALPSAYEGFPFTILEAMAAGTPVVASDIPGIDEQIVSEQTGLLHPVGAIGALAHQLSRVLIDRPLAATLARAARRMVVQQYDWSQIGAQTEQVLEGVAYHIQPDHATRPLDSRQVQRVYLSGPL
ncbi:MAG TPA: glycosyltransferase family 4 protein [Chloroflexia bacterium]|nr:glycosyltransferase family 4 protein [Chloroflexia bacterium]